MAILATEKVLTLDWWKPANKLEVGDYVFDKDGKIVQVKLVQEYFSDNCSRVTFNDWLSLSGDQHLTFMSENRKYRNQIHKYMGRKQFRRPLKPYTVQELKDLPLKDKRGRLAYSVPTTQPLQLPHQTLPVPPFVFGLWFFNQKSKGQFGVSAIYHDEVVSRLKDYGYKVKLGRKRPNNRQEFSITPSIESQLAPNIPTKIPNNYLLAAPDQRLELLQGIMMAKTGQYNEKTDKFRFSSFHYPTFSRVQALIESLGSKTTVFSQKSLSNHLLFFKTRLKLVSNQKSPPIKVHLGRRYIKQITELPPQMCVHIQTTSEDGTILVGEGFIPCR